VIFAVGIDKGKKAPTNDPTEDPTTDTDDTVVTSADCPVDAELTVTSLEAGSGPQTTQVEITLTVNRPGTSASA
jgi:hypothetical protein